MNAAEQAKKTKQKALKSPGYWFAVFARIIDKFGELITPKLNICQIRLAQAYEYCQANNIPFRAIVLKPRQVGITTMAAAICYHHIRRFRSNMTMIADNLARSDKLFQMILTFAKEDLFQWGSGYTSTADTLKLGNGSQVEKKTAGNSNATRGGTVQVVHQSEVAFWPADGVHNAKATSVALTNSIPDHADTIDIKESTPQGAAGVFADDWRRARWPDYDDYWKQYADHGGPGDPESAYIRVFAAWWEFGEHVRPVDEERIAVLRDTLTVREKRGRDLYDWSWEQIEWRRWTIKNKCSGSEVKFDEEYPEDPVKCFMASGNPRFDQEGLTYLEAIARATKWNTGVLSDKVGPGARPSFIPTSESESWFRMLEDPTEGLSYILITDVSSDRDMSKDVMETDLDKHSAGVFRAAYTDNLGVFRRAKLVARLAWPCEDGHDVYAMKLHLISQFYGDCPIVVEMNNHGLSLANKLKARGAVLFTRTFIDPKTNKSHQVVGWETTNKTRPDMIDSLASAIRDVDDPTKTNGLEVFCPHAVAELTTFVKTNGRAEAAAGCHDDDVIMIAIGNYLIGSAQRFVKRIHRSAMPNDGYKESRALLGKLGSVMGKM